MNHFVTSSSVYRFVVKRTARVKWLLSRFKFLRRVSLPVHFLHFLYLFFFFSYSNQREISCVLYSSFFFTPSLLIRVVWRSYDCNSWKRRKWHHWWEVCLMMLTESADRHQKHVWGMKSSWSDTNHDKDSLNDEVEMRHLDFRWETHVKPRFSIVFFDCKTRNQVIRVQLLLLM